MDEISNYSLEPDKFLDVPFVPTDEEAVEAMLELANVGPKDVLYDLGSGDGRILIAAAKSRNARGIGIEIDPTRIADATDEAKWIGVDYLVDFIEDDIFTADFGEATVVSLYLLESVNLQLRPRLLSELRPGTRIVSHAFGMGDWKADDWIKLNGTAIYKWTVPAKVEGAWEWDRSDGKLYRVELQQKYQDITGKAWLSGKRIRFESAELRGASLKLDLRENRSAPPERFMLTFSNNRLRSVATR